MYIYIYIYIFVYSYIHQGDLSAVSAISASPPSLAPSLASTAEAAVFGFCKLV